MLRHGRDAARGGGEGGGRLRPQMRGSRRRRGGREGVKRGMASGRRPREPRLGNSRGGPGRGAAVILAPRVSDMWRTDEMYCDIRGREQYAFWMIDDLTRYVLALQTAERKGTSDVKPLFEHAAALASMDAPAILVSDGAANFHRAWHDLYRAKNFMQRPAFHIQAVHATDADYNNNLMERFNGWIRARTRAARGLERIDSAMLRGLRVFHNFIRPHGGLGMITPAQAAGIVVERPNAAMTLAQNAAVHRLRRRP